MFAKAATFKPYAAIKNSERRSVLEKIEKQLKLNEEDPENRQQLLPKGVQSAKALTHGEEKITVYANDMVPLWVVLREKTLVPTVALVLSLPEDMQARLLPAVYTVGRTLQFLKNGADFMVPGIFGELPKSAGKGTVVAIRDIETGALLATGVALVDLGKLNPDVDKGKCVQTVSVVGDKLTPKTELQAAPKARPDGGAGQNQPSPPDAKPEAEPEAKPASEEAAASSAAKSAEKGAETSSEPVPSGEAETPAQPELTTQEIDELFMYALNRVIRSPQEYPMPMAAFSTLLMKCMADIDSSLSIRQTSFKKVNTLIKRAEKQGLLSSRERQGGELVITGVNVPVSAEAADSLAPPSRNGSGGKKPQARMLAEVRYKPHPNVQAIAEGVSMETAATLKNKMFEYIAAKKLAPPGAKSIPIDQPLRKALGLKQTSTEVDRDDVGKLVLKNCTPFHRIVPVGTDPNAAEWERGGLPTIQIKTERRGGNKQVTLVGQAGLRGFHIDPTEFADALRKVCAGSAALTDSKGFAAITVQGNHVAKIVQLLEKHGVRPAWIKS